VIATMLSAPRLSARTRGHLSAALRAFDHRSIVGCYFVRAREGGKIMNALYRGLIVAAAIALVLFWFVTRWILGPAAAAATCLGNLYLSAVVGIALTAALVYIRSTTPEPTLHRCATSRKPPPRPATNIIAGSRFR